MKQFFKRNLYKVALIVTLMAVATVAVTAGTFAALSAEYTWQSDETKAGEFNFANSNVNFTLFNKATVFPGNSGSGTIDKPDFGTNDVVWEFNETNENTIPMVYYFLDGSGNPTNVYSKYDFATVCADKYVKLSNKYVACESISPTASSILGGFATNDTIYWAWPNETYSDAEGTESAVAAYDAYNSDLCIVAAKFPTTAIINLFSSGDNLFAVATDVSEGVYTYEESATLLSGGKGHLKTASENICPLYSNGSFRTVTTADKINATECVLLLVAISKATALASAAETAGVNLVIDTTTKYACASNSATVSESGAYYLAKLYPDPIDDARPTVSVQITATVTQA